jgi:anti-sigma factor RsiW
MCDERERLIEYVYGEGDPAALRRVETHLTECHLCRTEVAGLRRLRDDLLAWDVPKHEPIWRPVPSEPVVAPRRPLPVWALATAAGVVFAVGVAGGVGMRSLATPPAAAAPVAVAAVTESVPAQQVSVTEADLARLEAAILERVRQEVSEQIRTAAPVAPAGGATRVNVGTRRDDMEARLAILEQWMDDQISLNNIFNSKFGSLNSRTSSLSEQIELSRLQRVGFEGSAR